MNYIFVTPPPPPPHQIKPLIFRGFLALFYLLLIRFSFCCLQNFSACKLFSEILPTPKEDLLTTDFSQKLLPNIFKHRDHTRFFLTDIKKIN